MAKSTETVNSFTHGEVSPLFKGRFDLDQYRSAVQTLENFLIYQTGGAMYAPGSIYVAETKDSSKKSRLTKFSYSTTQDYIIEAGDYYFRFFANSGQVVSAPSTPVEVVTPYAYTDLPIVHYCQKADTVYLFHPNYPTQKLTRTSSTSFSIGAAPFVRGPFMDQNITSTTITPSASTGAGITLTASVAIFDESHEGSLWRINSSSTVGAVVKITDVAAGGLKTSATADVQDEPDGTAGDIGGTGAYKKWAEGAYSAYRGYPATGCFYNQRLIIGGASGFPARFDGSNVGAYDNFNLDPNDTSTSFTFTIASDDVASIRWMNAVAGDLEIGTSSGTFNANGGSPGVAITSTAINVVNDTDYGVSHIQAERLGSYLYYFQSNNYLFRELTYNYLVNRNITKDMTQYADHILRDGGGAVDIDKQESPNDRFWIVRADGELAILTRNVDEQVLGWSRRTTNGLFESVCILVQEGSDDQIWVIVNRTIGGATKRYVEYFEQEYFTSQSDPIRLDSSLTYNGVPATVITGLDHLQGKIVSVVADGALPAGQQTYTVSSGSITLKHEASIVHVGLPYTGTIKLLPMSLGSRHGTGQTKKRKVYGVIARFHKTLGIKIGQDNSHLHAIPFSAVNDALDTAPSLYTGDMELPVENWWSDDENPVELVIKHDIPLPCMILALIIKSEVEER